MNMKRQMSDTFLIGSILAIVGGFLDAYTFICRGGVFANAQTGNIVLFGINFIEGRWQDSLNFLIPICSFAFGIIISEYIRHRFKNCENFHWRQIIIAFEIVILVGVTFIPQGNLNTLANVLISFVCALQIQSFRAIKGKAYVSTMCTGNLRNATEKLFAYKLTKNKADLFESLQYYAVIAFFIIGACIGSFITNKLGVLSLLYACAGLLFVFFIMFYKHPKTR